MKTTTKKRLLAILMIMVVAVTSIVPSIADSKHPFSDVPGSAWYNDAVNYCYQNNLINGVSTTQYNPDGTLSRADFVTILGRMAGAAKDMAPQQTFNDVDYNAYYAPYVTWASNEGIVNGYGYGKFGPLDPVTREQAAIMIARYERYMGRPTSYSGNPLNQFIDGNNVSSWAANDMKWAITRHLLHEPALQMLYPTSACTRADIAYVFYMYLTNGYVEYWTTLSNGLINQVPTYLQNDTADGIYKFNQAACYPGSDSFVFFTDPHFSHNSPGLDSAEVINAMYNHSTVDKLFCGGDLVAWGDYTQNKILGNYNTYWANYGSIVPGGKSFLVRGDHDFLGGYGSKTTYIADETTVNNLVMGNQSGRVVSVPGKNYYTYYNHDKHTAYIVLDTNNYAINYNGYKVYIMDSDEIYWIADTLADVPNDYTVVVMSHRPIPRVMAPDYAADLYAPVQKLIEAFANHRSVSVTFTDNYGYTRTISKDYRNKTSVLAACISGHEHADWYYQHDNVNYVCVDSDTMQNDAYSTNPNVTVYSPVNQHAANTSRSCVVDACVLNPTTRTLSLFRIGAGNDLVINY